MDLVAALGEPTHPLHLPEPGAKAAVGLIATVHGRMEGVEAEAEGRAHRQHLFAAAVEEVLDEAQHRNPRPAFLDTGRKEERLAEERRLARAPLERCAKRELPVGPAIDRVTQLRADGGE